MSEIATVRPWERQPKESHQAFQAFSLYRDQGYHRSVRKVAKVLAKDQRSIERWAVKWRWVERSDSYLAYLDEQARLAREDHLRRLHELETHGGQAALTLALKRLRGAAATDHAAAVAALDPNALTAAEVATLLQTGSRAMRLALDQPTDLGKNALMIHLNEASRQVGQVIDAALRYIPEEQQAAFLRELQGSQTSS